MVPKVCPFTVCQEISDLLPERNHKYILVEVGTRSACVAVSVPQGEAQDHELSDCKGCAMPRCM